MKKIKLYITSTIDGYIATSDGDLEWFIEYPNPEHLDYGFREFMSEIDIIVMDEQTYHNLLCMDIIWPYKIWSYKGKTTYIVSNNPNEGKTDGSISYIKGNSIEEFVRIKESQNIGLIGSSELMTMLLQNDLVDEMRISKIPILLGEGISLFSPFNPASDWDVRKNELYVNGVIQTVYRKKTR